MRVSHNFIIISSCSFPPLPILWERRNFCHKTNSGIILGSLRSGSSKDEFSMEGPSKGAGTGAGLLFLCLKLWDGVGAELSGALGWGLGTLGWGFRAGSLRAWGLPFPNLSSFSIKSCRDPSWLLNLCRSKPQMHNVSFLINSVFEHSIWAIMAWGPLPCPVLNLIFGTILPFFWCFCCIWSQPSSLWISTCSIWKEKAFWSNLFLSAEHFTPAWAKRGKFCPAEVLLCLMWEWGEGSVRHLLLMPLDMEMGQKWN